MTHVVLGLVMLVVGFALIGCGVGMCWTWFGRGRKKPETPTFPPKP